jgi:hypothetical protein
MCVSPLVNNNKLALKLSSDGQPSATVLCQFTEYSYNLSKLGDFLNTESDTRTDTKWKTCKKISPLGLGCVNIVAL